MSAPVDISKIKPGDTVLVRGIVQRVGDADYRGLSYVVCKPLYNEERPVVLLEHIVSHTPNAIAVGDRVRSLSWNTSDHTAEVLAIYRDRAWVKFSGDDGPDDMPLSDLERAK